MKPRTAKSMELYDILLRRGYPEPFCDEITKNLNTDWTAQRMIGYLSHYKKLPMEETADEFSGKLITCNEGDLKWVDKTIVPTLPTWEGDAIFLKLLLENEENFFTLKLVYEGESLVDQKLEIY